jgi:hypothetical protein
VGKKWQKVAKSAKNGPMFVAFWLHFYIFALNLKKKSCENPLNL